MACGTGKTLIALWAAERLKPKTVLVLVPSLTLLQQTLDEWTRHNSWGDAFSYICVCSDPTVASQDAHDPITFHRSDADFRIDTDPKEVVRFLQGTKTSVKVIFSTYQSSAVVSQATRGLALLDIAIFDEAHKTTGPKGGLFAHCLSDDNIKIRRRLFLTATPRHYDIRHRNREGDFRILSMDDGSIYGPRAYTLTFGSAAHQGIICNYKVVISVVDGQEVNAFALKHGITLVKGDLIGARWVANQIAIERAIEKTSAVRAITFHSRVSSAKEFSADTSRGIQQWLPDFSVFHVNGTQRSSERKQLILSFRNATKAVITNARCLTEGTDVPAVDMVAFIDPRHSKIDIAQATGRAMRKPTGPDKMIGYVVVPLFLERKKAETLEEAFKRSDFFNIAAILNAMQEQDDELVQIIQELQEAKGHGEIFNPRRLADKVEVVGPSIDLSTLRKDIFVEIRDSIGTSWDEWYGCLKVYKEREGHCLVPVAHREGDYRLGRWVSNVRTTKDKIEEARRRQLDELGFVWDALHAAWERGFDALKLCKEREGHCNVPRPHIEGGFRLGKWVGTQRINKDTMPAERKRRLDAIGFIWNARESEWEEGFAALRAFLAREGHCNVPAAHMEGAHRLGRWVNHLRVIRDTIPAQRKQRLDAMGFVWDVLDTQWEEGVAALTLFKAREGHCLCSGNHVEGTFKLGGWVSRQRARSHKIPERRQRLDALGFVWDVREREWEEGCTALAHFKAREGHWRVPKLHKEGAFNLGQWVNNLRGNKDTIPSDRKRRLETMGMDWNARENEWEKGFTALTKFKARGGHCRVPRHQLEGAFNLAKWVRKQRANQKTISSERQQRLDAIGFVWGVLDSQWEEGFAALTQFKAREGHCRVPASHMEGKFNLGRWVTVKRRDRNILSAERRNQLDAIGFVWAFRNTEWEKGFAALGQFKAREGHCHVPKLHMEDTFKLGHWLSAQRSRTTSIERKQQLIAIGFVWDVLEAKWEEGLAALITFKEREGHCRVLNLHVEGAFKLGQWVRVQRSRKAVMSADRRKRLDKIGFAWRR